MEVRIEMYAKKDPKNLPDESSLILVAYFTMAARDNKTLKAAPGIAQMKRGVNSNYFFAVNTLLLQTERQKQLFEQGELHKQKRLHVCCLCYL